jgi:hypothetical protein
MLRGQMRKVNTGLTSSNKVELLNTSYSYRCALLIGSSFVFFEVVFLILYANDFWFSFNISAWGIVAVCLAAIAAHFSLCAIESPLGCRLAKPIRHGLPLVFYRHWLTISQEYLGAGSRKILWESVSKLHLTVFGNLQIWSDRLCGTGQYDLVLSFPFSCTRLADKQRFVDAAHQGNSQLILSARLQRHLKKSRAHSARVAEIVTMLVLSWLLLDLGRGSFALLEILKDYYLAQTHELQGHNVQAVRYFAAGDRILNNQRTFSWINSKLFNDGPIAAGVHKARSEALWQLGRKQEALEEAELAVKLNPHSFRLNLHQARILDALGKHDAAHEQLILAIKNRKDLLLPRLYLLAWLQAGDSSEAARSYYQITLNDLKDQVFGEEPCWPPGGNHFLPETIYQEDLRYVLDRLL